MPAAFLLVMSVSVRISVFSVCLCYSHSLFSLIKDPGLFDEKCFWQIHPRLLRAIAVTLGGGKGGGGGWGSDTDKGVSTG